MARRHLWIPAIVAIVAYFAVAAWLQNSYVDPTPKGRVVVQLMRPFERIENAYICRCTGKLTAFADSDHIEADTSSPVLLYENGKQIGQAHNNFRDIRDHGAGRFSHLRGSFTFSSSDNSDVATNGRAYWAVLP